MAGWRGDERDHDARIVLPAEKPVLPGADAAPQDRAGRRTAGRMARRRAPGRCSCLPVREQAVLRFDEPETVADHGAGGRIVQAGDERAQGEPIAVDARQRDLPAIWAGTERVALEQHKPAARQRAQRIHVLQRPGRQQAADGAGPAVGGDGDAHQRGGGGQQAHDHVAGAVHGNAVQTDVGAVTVGEDGLTGERRGPFFQTCSAVPSGLSRSTRGWRESVTYRRPWVSSARSLQ